MKPILKLNGVDPNEFVIQVAVKRAGHGMACKSFYFDDGEWHYQFDIAMEGSDASDAFCAGSTTCGHPSVAAQEAMLSLLEAFALVVPEEDLPHLHAEYMQGKSEHGSN